MKKILILFAVFGLGLTARAQKVTELTESTAVGETSLMITREGATGNLLKRITIANLFTGRTLLGTTALPATTSIGAVSAAEIAYVDGATSNIQAQLNDTVDFDTEELTNAVIISVGDTSVTAIVGRIVFKTSDTHLYLCTKLTAKKWYRIVLLGD
jgi:hypothetical protein